MEVVWRNEDKECYMTASATLLHRTIAGHVHGLEPPFLGVLEYLHHPVHMRVSSTHTQPLNMSTRAECRREGAVVGLLVYAQW